MQPTRRFWTVAAMAGFLAVVSALLGRPVLLYGGIGLSAYLLAHQLVFVTRLRVALMHLEISQSVIPEQPMTGQPVELQVDAALYGPVPSLELRVMPDPPLGTLSPDGARHPVTLDEGTPTGTTSLTLESAVTGEFRVDPPIVTVSSASGLLQEDVRVGPTATVTVHPRTPRNLHLGHGGTEVAAGFGEHRTGQHGPGIEPAELRAYSPGDPASRIDWKATARLNEPHVLEFETETDRTTVLLVDGRASMRTGREGQTKFDYVREMALAMIGFAADATDPLGLYAVGDDGLTHRFEPAAAQRRYPVLRRELFRLSPTAGDPSVVGKRQSIATARRLARRLANDDSAFATRLHPLIADRDPYLARLEEDPLFQTARAEIATRHTRTWTVLLTDDTRRTEVRETVKVLRRGDSQVLVCLTPDVLFDSGGLADLPTAYDEYLDFEEFRRDLDRLERVTALELAPGERLNAVLAVGRERRRREVRG